MGPPGFIYMSRRSSISVEYEIDTPPTLDGHPVGKMAGGAWASFPFPPAQVQEALLASASEWRLVGRTDTRVVLRCQRITRGSWSGVTAVFHFDGDGPTRVRSEAALNRSGLGWIQIYDGSNERGRLTHRLLKSTAAWLGEGDVNGRWSRRAVVALVVMILLSLAWGLFVARLLMG